MSIFAFNPVGGVKASITEMNQYSHKKSYWARIVRKDGAIEYKYLQKESRDHKNLEEAIEKGDVNHVMMWEEEEIKDTKEIIKMVVDQVQAAMIMAHIQKQGLHNLLKEDKKLAGRGFPEKNYRELQAAIVHELAEINSHLRNVANMLLGESSKS